jgi:hypothetical protein
MDCQIDVAGVNRALGCGYNLAQIASHLHVRLEELERVLEVSKGRTNRHCTTPRTHTCVKSASVALAEYRNLYWFDACRHCNGDLYVDDDEIKCLECGRILHPKEQMFLLERTKRHGRFS